MDNSKGRSTKFDHKQKTNQDLRLSLQPNARIMEELEITFDQTTSWDDGERNSITLDNKICWIVNIIRDEARSLPYMGGQSITDFLFLNAN